MLFLFFFQMRFEQKKKSHADSIPHFVRIFTLECSIMPFPSFILVPNLYEVVMEEKENLWKIEFCNASQCPYFSSWWHNKRELQKVIVE